MPIATATYKIRIRTLLAVACAATSVTVTEPAARAEIGDSNNKKLKIKTLEDVINLQNTEFVIGGGSADACLRQARERYNRERARDVGNKSGNLK